MRARAQAKAKKAEAVVSRTKVQTVMTLHDSIFPDIKLPGGISSKATEYAELAAKGEKWESPIFSIGDASESKHIPSAGDVTRKPHTTAEDRAGPAGAAGAAGAATAAGGVATSGVATTLPGTNGTTKVDGYPSRGFSDEVDEAFVNDKTNGLGAGIKPATNGTNGTTRNGTTHVTNGSAAVV
jgi:hypothetical protein